MTELKLLIEGDVKEPTRSNITDAGIDFYIPNDHPQVVLKFGDDVVIDTKVRCILPAMTAFIAFNKSGRATRDGLTVGACVIDEGYQGTLNIHVIKSVRKKISFMQKIRNLYNYGHFGDVTILNPGEKLTQFVTVLTQYGSPNISKNINKEDFFDGIESERGTGKMGSTGLK